MSLPKFSDVFLLHSRLSSTTEPCWLSGFSPLNTVKDLYSKMAPEPTYKAPKSPKLRTGTCKSNLDVRWFTKLALHMPIYIPSIASKAAITWLRSLLRYVSDLPSKLDHARGVLRYDCKPAGCHDERHEKCKDEICRIVCDGHERTPSGLPKAQYFERTRHGYFAMALSRVVQEQSTFGQQRTPRT